MYKKLLLLALISFTFNLINAQNVLINEGFETWPAEGWNTYELGVTGGWIKDLVTGYHSDHSAKHPSSTEGQSKNWLVSPPVSLDNTTDYQLSFYSFSSYGDNLKVMISTASGDPNSGDFVSLQSVEGSTWWIPISIDLSAYQGQDVYIAFYVFSNTQYSARVDNVLMAPINYIDAGLTEIVSPTGFNPEIGNEDVVVQVKNFGTETISDFSIQWTVNDVFQTQFDGTGSLDPDSSVDVTIGQYDFTEGLYSISALINVIDDAWAGNNLTTTEYSAGVKFDIVLNSISPSGSYPTAGTKDVSIKVSNNGSTIITELAIEWSVDDINQPVFDATGLSILPGDYSIITIGQYSFAEGSHSIDVSIPMDFDLTPQNNIRQEIYTTGSFYEDFEGEWPSLLWETYYQTRGNWAPQNNDSSNYHIYMIASNNNLGSLNDSLFTPLLDIEDGDTFTFKTRFPSYWPGTVSLLWKDGITGEIHIIQDPIPTIWGWSEQSFDISAAAGINRIGWVCIAEDPIGDVIMDDISSTAPIFYLNNDLLVNDFVLDTVPQINKEVSIRCSVVNIGLNPILGPDYTIKLMNGTTLLTSVSGQNILSPGEINIEFSYIFTEVGEFPLHIEVDYVIDESLSTNLSNEITVYPVPENTLYTNIGQPDYGHYGLPFNPIGYEFSGEEDLSQSLFYSNEIGAPGDIYGIKYHYLNYSGYGSSMSVQIWIAETTDDNLESGWYPEETFQLVFDGEIEFTLGSPYTYIPFDIPFSYDGTKNLVIQNYAYEPVWGIPNIRYYVTAADEQIRSLYIDDRTNIDPSNPPAGYTTSTNHPFTTFVLSPTANTGVVTGFVYDENNNPLANAEVLVEGTSVSTQTDETGAYSLQGIVFNEYSITASLFAYDATTQILNIDQPSHTMDFNLTLKPQITVSGNIVGSNSPSSPIPNVTVTLEGYSPFESTSNTTGDFTMPDVYGNVEYTLNLSLYGYEDYTEVITIEDQNLDLGTIIMQESMLSTYNVDADGNAWETTVTWEIPNTGQEMTYVNDGGIDYAGFANEPNENVWLGNYFPNPGTITINDVDIHWTFTEGGASDFVTVDIFNENEEIIASSERFLTPYNQWINVDLPNMTITGDFYVMVHWEENPETTHFFSYNWTWSPQPDDINSASIKYPNENIQLLTDYLEAGTPVMNFMIRPNVIEPGVNGNDNNIVSYNIYKGFASEIEDVDLWAMLNTSPINDLVYIDNDWSVDYPDGTYVYAVEAIYTEGIAEFTFSNTVDIIITGIEDILANNISVYPNPANAYINISGIQNSELQLYDVMGKLIYSEHIETDQSRINVADLPAGSYVLHIVIDNEVITKKVSITKR